ncbi:hypothetical protein SLS56_006913 [Neofusicoccum ribis]|uniref:Peptidase A1 domain-containing protein n=1 Tax=Neofusicoccum ribis TaxID=45134 RepID=A0ABR3SPY8_9PEZI
MSSTSVSILLPAVFAAAAVAAPAPQDLGETFSIPQVANGTERMNGPLSMVRTYRKYGIDIPDFVSEAVANMAAAAQAGDISARSVAANPSDYFDTLYLSPVTLGSDSLNLYLDTGSADLWAFSTLMAAGSTNGQSLYNPSRSGTLLPQQSWSVTYGDGSGGSGLVYADRVVVGEVTATKQSVEAATSASTLFVQDTNSDGVMGLAFSALNSVRPTPQRTFFDTVKSQLSKPLFTALLKKGAPGKYDFGFLNASSYTGSIAYTNVLTTPRPGFWGFNATGYSVGTGNIVQKTMPSIVDTGTTLFYLPSDVVAAYYGQIPGASYSPTFGGWILPCTSRPPAFNTVISGSLVSMPGSYVIYGAVDQNNNCYGGIQENTAIGFSIYGLIFLKSQYIIFDQTTASAPRIGFARQTGVTYS